MILTCPSCGTQYVVKDGAIPPNGRQVRCASCKHSWHQNPEDQEPLDLGATSVDEGPAEEPVRQADYGDEQPGHDDAPDDLDRVDAADAPIEARAAAQQSLAADEFGEHFEPLPPVAADEQGWAGGQDERDDFSPFAQHDPIEREERGPWLKILLTLLLIAALAAAFWFLAPTSIKQRLGIVAAAETPLQVMFTHSDRQLLASGNELLAVSGRVINPTAETQPVPPIQAELRTKAGKLVYSWTIRPPAPTLGPNESRTFNSAEMNVPAGGEELTISLGPVRT